MNASYAARLRDAKFGIGAPVRPRAAYTKQIDLADVLHQQIRAMQLPEPERDAELVPNRKFRTDLCWRSRLLFAEVDGGEFMHGRHGRGTGMQSDCIKWNALTLLGWSGFRFVGSQVRSGYAIDVLEQALR